MKQCPNCSAKNQDNAVICENCGADLKDAAITHDERSAVATNFLKKTGDVFNAGAKKAKNAAEAGTAKVKAYQAEQEAHQRELLKGSEKFVDQSETTVATLGDNYLQNFLLGKRIKRGAAILTQKRLYYYGKQFLGKGKTTTKDTEETVIPLEEISLTRFVHSQPIGLILFGVLLMIGGVVLVYASPLRWFMGDLAYQKEMQAYGFSFSYMSLILRYLPYFFGTIALGGAGIVSIITGFARRTTLFEISYPGGRYFFNVKYYPIADMRDFQRQLHLMRDNLKND